MPPRCGAHGPIDPERAAPGVAAEGRRGEPDLLGARARGRRRSTPTQWKARKEREGDDGERVRREREERERDGRVRK